MLQRASLKPKLEEVEESKTSWTAPERDEMLYVLQCYVC